MEHKKIVILGCGIAGLSLALFLKKSGVNDFVILNASNSKIHKACTGLLTEKTFNLLNELEVSLAGYEKITNNISTRFFNEKDIDLSDSGISVYHHKDTGRVSLDNALLDKAKSLGVTIIENCKNITIDDKNKLVSYNDNYISFDYVVDARGFYNDINKTRHKDIGFECKIEHSCDNKNKHICIFFDKKIKGYGWFIYGANYDVFGFTDEYKKNVDYKSLLAELMDFYYEREAITKTDVKLAYIPIKPSKQYVNKHHINLGDKAGLVDPLTQEGIYFAIYSAKLAASAIKNDNLKQYKKEIIDVTNNFKFAYKIRKYFFKPEYLHKLALYIQKHAFIKYLFNRYSNDLTYFNYKKILKYKDDYNHFSKN